MNMCNDDLRILCVLNSDKDIATNKTSLKLRLLRLLP